ncbi:MAG TPA: beta-N-acetylhexosaminidase [Mycobacteriales bacterium]|nr:beta-N-acetylhexosaminidase [Mycobacteriales bacterium]
MSDDLAVIPRPDRVTRLGPAFSFDAETVLAAPAALREVAELIGAELRRGTALPLPLTDGEQNAIRLAVDPDLGAEAYRLRVDPEVVSITGGDPAGVFYGYQTLKQLLPPEIFNSATERREWTLPGVEIEDRPAFGWRGSMLDVGRHFMPKEFIFRYLDLLALHKLNVFHWHLTDDQGWRIEIRRYPKLTEIGAWRSETLIGRPSRDTDAREVFDGRRHGGFYTQDDAREVVEYAARRFITVVPEIEVPGHTQAAMAAYPELSNLDEPLEVWRRWGIAEHALNVEESTVEFFKNVYDEIFGLFPSTFIHVGGDECLKDDWRESPRAQERMRELGLSEEDELQSWFITRLDEYFTERGRRLLGWDEILEGGLALGATVLSWRGEEGGIAAAKSGHDVVMCPTSHVYFDYYQSEDQDAEPLAIGGYVPLEQVYEYNPVPGELSDHADRVLGSQFQVWTEYMPTPRHVEYMVFPRACAFAEVVWSRERSSFADFRDRLETHFRRLDRLDVNYRKGH